MIILGPELAKSWAYAGKLCPLTSKSSSKCSGCMIGITLQFPNISNRKNTKFKHRVKVFIKLFLYSVHHPYEHDEQKYFYEELDIFYSRRLRNSEILLRVGINCNVGTRTKMFGDVVGLNGIKIRT